MFFVFKSLKKKLAALNSKVFFVERHEWIECIEFLIDWKIVPLDYHSSRWPRNELIMFFGVLSVTRYKAEIYSTNIGGLKKKQFPIYFGSFIVVLHFMPSIGQWALGLSMLTQIDFL